MSTYILRFMFLLLTTRTACAFAATPNPTAEMRVTANVTKFCTATASPLTFGRYFYEELNARINVTIQCTLGTQYYIGVNQPIEGRSMVSSSDHKLRYILYQDMGRSRVLGNIVGQNTISGIGTGTVDVITIYGLVEGEQTAESGRYTDNLNITVSF